MHVTAHFLKAGVVLNEDRGKPALEQVAATLAAQVEPDAVLITDAHPIIEFRDVIDIKGT